MLSSLLSISEEYNIQELIDLDDKCIQILLFLLLHIDQTFNHNQLKRNLNDYGLNFQEPTYSRHLNHLEEKKYIIRIRNHTTTIKVNVNTFEHKSKIKKATEVTINKLNDIKESIKKYNTIELFNKTKQCYMEKASASFLIKLRYVNKSIQENEYHFGYLWINILYEYLSDIYVKEMA
jgi:hypothetical protein